MHTAKNLLIAFVLICCAHLVSAQEGPPPPARPTKENKEIIDQIIAVTHHEQYFKEYCTKHVLQVASSQSWPVSRKNKILKSIRFEYYDDTIYNSYAFYSTKQLKSLLDALVLLNDNLKVRDRMVLTNSMMQSNLEVFLEALIEGKYVVE